MKNRTLPAKSPTTTKPTAYIVRRYTIRRDLAATISKAAAREGLTLAAFVSRAVHRDLSTITPPLA